MSFDVFFQPFREGDAGEADADLVLRLLAQHVVRQEDEHGFALLKVPDGEADLYGMDDLGDGFMANHVTGRLAWDFFVGLARAADLAILAPGCRPMVCSDGQRAHLPEELRDEAAIVASGAEAIRVIESG